VTKWNILAKTSNIVWNPINWSIFEWI